MSLAACCMSHSPLIGTIDPEPPIRQEIDDALAGARKFVDEVDPELVVIFGPDHLNGFLYKVLPQFCVGTRATAIGDFGSAKGPLSVDADLAQDCAEAVLKAGIDIALSIDMTVDHGFAQPLAMLLGDLDARPVVPIFINAAPPRSSTGRSRLLGRAVGAWASSLGIRVLVVGSGGLSHDPPGASLAGASPEVLRRLTFGLEPEARARREITVVDVAQEFAHGRGDLKPLAPDFDESFLSLLASGDLDEVDAWEDEFLTTHYGRAVHEIRTWVAAFAALGTAGPYELRRRYYRPIPEWIVGFGLVTAETSAS